MSATHQSTLKTSISITGRGLHTGEECRIILHPAGVDHGIVFGKGSVRIPANVSYVSDTNRGTSLSWSGEDIHTVEHLLAALTGLSIDNVFIETHGIEIPAVDGSALPFVDAIESAGVEEQDAFIKDMQPPLPIWVNQGDKYLVAVPSEKLEICALIMFPHPMISEQIIDLQISPTVFKQEIAPARTFCTSNEIEAILSQGLGRGGTEDNVVIACEDHYSVPLRFKDEFIRHKVLDIIGDLALIGCRLKADITAIKSSHTLNVILADKISKL